MLSLKNFSRNRLPRESFNVLCLYPAELSNIRDENAPVFIEVHKMKAKLAFIAVRSSWRGKGKLQDYENMEGIRIHRLYRNLKETFLFPQRKLKKALKIAKDLNPDLIFCVNELNMRLALLLQKYLKVPIVLRVEDAGSIFSGVSESQLLRVRCAMGLLGMPSGGAPTFWSWLCEKAEALITCHPRDERLLDLLSKAGKPAFYVPWPCHIPSDFEIPSTRYKYRGIYVGSLRPFKNTQEFEKTLPKILENTYTKEFIVTGGTGPHASIIEKLQKKFRRAIKYIPQIPKNKLLALISSSYYAYTPVRTGGWGFIGDCWGLRTPIVMTHNDGYVADGSNALVAQNEDDLIRNINRLYDDRKLYEILQKNGYREYEKRAPSVVGDRLYSIFVKTLERRRKNE